MPILRIPVKSNISVNEIVDIINVLFISGLICRAAAMR